MKKKKTITLLALVFSVGFILASCGKPTTPKSSSVAESSSVSESKSESASDSVSDSDSDTTSSSSEQTAPVLSNLQVNTSAAKVGYDLGEDFDATGITASATLTENGQSRQIDFALSELNIDSSAFNKNIANYYTIKVSPKAYASVESSYSVSVYGRLQATPTKTVFSLNEEFTTEGLSLSYFRGVDASGNDVKSEVKVKSSSVTVDSSTYDATRLGTYEIVISYAIDSNKTLTTKYSVEVQSKVSGLSVSKTVTKYSLNGSLTTTIPTDDLVVKGVNQYGLVEETALAASDYTLSYYKDGTTKIDSLENVGSGIYQIWAERQITLYGETYTVSDFVIVYVNDPLIGIALGSDEGILLSQEEGKDSISSTWKFNLTYASGKVESLDASSVTIKGLDTKTVAEKAKATITYTGTDSDGTTYPVSTEVEYTITAAAPSGDDLGYKAKTYTRKACGDDPVSITEELPIISDEANKNFVSVLATSAKAVAVDESAGSYGDLEFTHRFKLNGAGSTAHRSLKIVVSRDATFRAWFKTGSSSQERSLSLYDSAGTIVDGTTTSASGSAMSRMEVSLSAGTYYVFGASACNVYGVQIDTTVPKQIVNKQYTRKAGADDPVSITEELPIISDEANKNFVSVLATSAKAVAVDESAGSYGDLEFTHRFKLNGAGSTAHRSLKIVVSRDATFRAWFKTGSSSQERSLSLYDSAGTIVDGTTTSASGSAMSRMEVSLSAGTYYVFGASACNVYGVQIDTTIVE